MSMPPMAAMARAMAQKEEMGLRLKRTYATIVGEMPNAKGQTAYDTRTGLRMALLCGAELPWINLFDKYRAWDEEEAEAAAWMWLSSRVNESAPLLLLGARVCRAFNLPPDHEWLEWYRSPQHGHPMIAFPHPTRSRWMRSTENALAAGLMAANVAHNRLPQTDYNKEENA